MNKSLLLTCQKQTYRGEKRESVISFGAAIKQRVHQSDSQMGCQVSDSKLVCHIENSVDSVLSNLLVFMVLDLKS